MSKRDAEIYRTAAERVCAEENYFSSCEAIAALVADGLFSIQVRRYDYLFRPYKNEKNNPLYWGREWSDNDRERQECRVIALLFMAAIAETE